MEFIAFDIETRADVRGFEPLIGATAARDEAGDIVVTYYDENGGGNRLLDFLGVDLMTAGSVKGLTVTAWNGAAFDCRHMGQRPGADLGRWKQIALRMYDPMCCVMCHKGFPVGLDAVCQRMLGAGQGKVKTVTLNDGSTLKDMDGLKVEALWDAGEHDAVKQYLRGDVVQQLLVTELIHRTGSIQWTSRAGHPQAAHAQPWSVAEALMLPAPDTSWMRPRNGKPPLTREGLWGWLKDE